MSGGDGVMRRLVRVALLLLIVVLSPLLPMLVSGRWAWWQAWVVAGVFVGGFVVSRALAARRNPGILQERASYLRNEGTAAWDKVLSPLVAFGTVVILLVAGLDARWGWSAGFPLVVELVGLGLIVAGYVLGSWALIENAWFSGTVRVQPERGQEVVSSGPYRWVRHPGYLGTLATAVGLPLLLDSAWSLVPAAAYAAVVVTRSALEDQFLHDHLPGYAGYTERVPHRLLPGLW